MPSFSSPVCKSCGGPVRQVCVQHGQLPQRQKQKHTAKPLTQVLGMHRVIHRPNATSDRLSEFCACSRGIPTYAQQKTHKPFHRCHPGCSDLASSPGELEVGILYIEFAEPECKVECKVRVSSNSSIWSLGSRPRCLQRRCILKTHAGCQVLTSLQARKTTLLHDFDDICSCKQSSTCGIHNGAPSSGSPTTKPARPPLFPLFPGLILPYFSSQVAKLSLNRAPWG